MLRHSDVTRRLTAPISAGPLTDTSSYFRALTEYREGRVEPIVRQFINATFRALSNGRQLVDELDGIHTSWSEGLASRHGAAARRLLPHLLDQPAVDVRYIERTTGVALSAAQRAVGQLEAVGILTRAGSGSRNRVWLAPEVIEALDRFAERVGRRG